MKKLFAIFLLLGSFLYSSDIDTIVVGIKRNCLETNKYKNYRVETETIDRDEGIEITKYYKNRELKKVVLEAYTLDLKKHVEYYIEDGKTYFKYIEISDLYNKNLVTTFKFYYDSRENLVRYIDDKGEMFEGEYLRRYPNYLRGKKNILDREDNLSYPWREFDRYN